jgi:hypothetical protein
LRRRRRKRLGCARRAGFARDLGPLRREGLGLGHLNPIQAAQLYRDVFID